MTQNYSLYSLHKVWSARYLVCKMSPFGPLQTGPWSTGLHGLDCRLYPTQDGGQDADRVKHRQIGHGLPGVGGRGLRQRPTTSLRKIHGWMVLTRAVRISRRKNHMLAAGIRQQGGGGVHHYWIKMLVLFIPRHTIVAGYYGFTMDVRVSVRPSIVCPSVRPFFVSG